MFSDTIYLENKITDLETKLAFQDETINELNEVITDDELREEIRLLNLRIVSIAESTPNSNEEEPPPPHY